MSVLEVFERVDGSPGCFALSGPFGAFESEKHVLAAKRGDHSSVIIDRCFL